MLTFNFDERKSRANAKKHGIDFIQAQELWNDPYLIEIPAMTVDEPRFLVIGRIGAKHWSAVITPPKREHSNHLRSPVSSGRGDPL